MAAFGWIVKEVPSGDTVHVVSTDVVDGSAPAEKRISLASLTAPRMVRLNDGQSCVAGRNHCIVRLTFWAEHGCEA
jgi:hypothetical protein